MIVVADTPFNPGEQINLFSKANQSAGAIASFLGQVRSEGGQVSILTLQSYPGVTEQGIQDAEEQARARWSLTDVQITHRIGTMNVGDPIVLVLTAAKHRRDAFQACDFLMDYLKTEAVFWKKQAGKDSEEWIEPRSQDYQDNQRWSE